MKTWAANETSIHIHLVVSIFFASLEFATHWHRCEAGHANWVIALRKVLASASKVVDGIATTRQFRGAGLGLNTPEGVGVTQNGVRRAQRRETKTARSIFVADGDAGVRSLNPFL